MDGVHHPSATGTLVGSSGVVAKNTLASLDAHAELAFTQHEEALQESRDTYKWSHAASRLLANGSTVGLEKASSDNGGGGCHSLLS